MEALQNTHGHHREEQKVQILGTVQKEDNEEQGISPEQSI